MPFLPAVLLEYAKIRDLGFATCIGEIDDNMAAVAVPLHVYGTPVEFSLALTGPRTRIVEKDLSALAEILTAFAQKVSASFAIALADPSKHDENKQEQSSRSKRSPVEAVKEWPVGSTSNERRYES